MRVGFFSPLPPARTGVADYSSVLLRYLRNLGRVEVSRGGDTNLYHLGNNHLHAAIYERALRDPGVVVLHDAVLHHFFLGTLPQSRYVDEFVYNYGEWARDLAASFWKGRARSASDHRYFQYPMLRRICELSHAVVVHNPAAAAMVQRHAPQANIVEIPHLFEEAPSSLPADQTRRQLDIPTKALLAGVFGHLRESKRILPILRTFRRLQPSPAFLLLAGEVGSRDLSRAIEPFLSDSHIRRLPYTPDDEFWAVARATDICINLRYPAAGESSGITTRFMGIGKPVIVTEGAEVSRLPAAACVRIEPGLREEGQLQEVLRWLCSMPQHARDIGTIAARHIREHHSPAAVADLYWQTLRNARS